MPWRRRRKRISSWPDVAAWACSDAPFLAASVITSCTTPTAPFWCAGSNPFSSFLILIFTSTFDKHNECPFKLRSDSHFTNSIVIYTIEQKAIYNGVITSIKKTYRTLGLRSRSSKCYKSFFFVLDPEWLHNWFDSEKHFLDIPFFLFNIMFKKKSILNIVCDFLEFLEISNLTDMTKPKLLF